VAAVAVTAAKSSASVRCFIGPLSRRRQGNRFAMRSWQRAGVDTPCGFSRLTFRCGAICEWSRGDDLTGDRQVVDFEPGNAGFGLRCAAMRIAGVECEEECGPPRRRAASTHTSIDRGRRRTMVATAGGYGVTLTF